MCRNDTCPMCDPGIEAFYQQKLKETEISLKKAGINAKPDDYLDAKDIWYEYCELKRQQEAEETADKLFTGEWIDKWE